MDKEQAKYFFPAKFQDYSHDMMESMRGFIDYQELYDIEQEIEALMRVEENILKTRNELERLSKIYFSRLDSLRLRRGRSKYSNER